MPLVKDYLGGVEVKAGDIVLFENVRFNKGEKKTPTSWPADGRPVTLFVMDAFAPPTAPRVRPTAWPVRQGRLRRPAAGCRAGRPGQGLGDPQRPMAAIVAGSRVSTKLDVLNSRSQICDS